ncbi:antibiotic biosynthesis monooxygenase family protein [Catenuloplanes atrovinosus]|uniref:Quinol monooxygenase YgiN n=1 Tax=Catenuloplanes atrovinosus TaxID=137266 RepID=A0AAE4C872_9ACTN|nr:antibiotic biosynthesis monooxygenase [Catenuloplanes atrovinosus]MDR7275216.1 quinol monooxygenase YgiN [Catenuloplanes atrovinosus]
MSVFVRARFEPLAGRRDDFVALARALTARAADEPGTLTYRWFGPDRGGYLVIEQYADSAAALAHNARCADLLAEVPRTATMVTAELYGPLGHDLLTWASAHPQVTTYPDLALVPSGSAAADPGPDDGAGQQ